MLPIQPEGLRFLKVKYGLTTEDWIQSHVGCRDTVLNVEINGQWAYGEPRKQKAVVFNDPEWVGMYIKGVPEKNHYKLAFR